MRPAARERSRLLRVLLSGPLGVGPAALILQRLERDVLAQARVLDRLGLVRVERVPPGVVRLELTPLGRDTAERLRRDARGADT